MKIWRKVSVIALALGMTLGLCACGKKGVSTDPSLGKQYVYHMDEFDLSSLQDSEGDSYLRNCFQRDGKVYILFQSYGLAGTEYKFASLNMDGTGVQVFDLQTDPDGAGSNAPNEAVQTEEPDDADADDGAQEDVAQDETAADGDGQEDAAADGDGQEETETEDVDGADIVDEEVDGKYQYTNFDQFQIMDAGCIVAVKEFVTEDYTDANEYFSKRESYVCGWDLEGKMIWQTPMEELSTQDSWSYIRNALPIKGGVALLIAGDKAGVRTVDAKGNLSESKSVDPAFLELLDRAEGFCSTQDGKIMFTYRGENWTDMFIRTYDLNTDTMTQEITLPSSMMNSDMGTLVTDAGGDLIYTNNQGVFRYHFGDAEPTQMMSYVNSDLEINGLNAVIPVDSDHFVGVYSRYDEQNLIYGGTFTRVDPADIPDKAVLLLAGNYIPQDVRKRVIEFNKTSSTHRIVLKDYSMYETYDDFYSGLTQLNNDILSGGMPDIMIADGNGGLNLESYINKGMLADIGKLIEKDEKLSQMEFLENIFDACRVDGKLYEIIPNFTVGTYVGKTSLVGDREGWTMEEAQELLKTMPEGTTLFGEMSNSGFINVVMEQCGSDFVDISTGKCSFDSPEFIALMEYAKSLPTPQDLEHGGEYDYDAWYKDYESQYRENRTLLANCYIGNFENLVYLINGNFGEDISYVGFPGTSGRGAVVYTNTSYVLSAKSANLDAAWDFMSYYLTEEYQDTIEWMLPVSKKRFDEIAQKGMERPYYEENGEKVEYDYSYWSGNEEIKLDPLTQQQVDKAKAFIGTVTKRAYRNQTVQNIITEEIEAYFKGDKTAKDTASVIQSRAQIYVNENR